MPVEHPVMRIDLAIKYLYCLFFKPIAYNINLGVVTSSSWLVQYENS